ncbi:MAG: helix-turn-helix transcriptional regulator [Firmicutes bacterium]|nr:helix-turn-helix transcriptional regulator [Bacillota bacterium]
MKSVLGERVRERRLALGLSVQEVARRAKVSASYIYAIEAGVRGSQIAKLARVAEALDIDLATLYRSAGK